jgi:opacity protein-like surface antigen
MKFLLHLILNTVVTACILTLPAVSFAQSGDTGPFIGASYGMVRVEDSDFDDDNEFGQLYAGYQILPFLGIKASYYDFGEYGNAFANADTEATSIALTGRIPVSDAFALYAEFGPMWWETDVNVGPFSGNYDGKDLRFGTGFSFALTPNLDLQAEYNWIDVDLDDSDLVTTTPGDFDSELRTVSLGLKLQF